MRRARYVGVGKLSDESLRGDLNWHCEAYWPDGACDCPTVLVVSIEALTLKGKLRDARLNRVDDSFSRQASFTTSDWPGSSGPDRRPAGIAVRLRLEGFEGNQVVLSGTWREENHFGQATTDFVLRGDFVESGNGEPLSQNGVGRQKGKCNVQHVAHQLEEQLVKLAERRILLSGDAKILRELLKEYWEGDCNGQACQPGTCAFHQSHSWLEVPYRYKSIHDVLWYESSGISDDSPKLRVRHGVDALDVPLRRPGHYNP